MKVKGEFEMEVSTEDEGEIVHKFELFLLSVRQFHLAGSNAEIGKFETAKTTKTTRTFNANSGRFIYDV